jgi:putative colanic acid biosynthesis acetyltransferase WcaF
MNLEIYNNKGFNHGKSILYRALWMLVSSLFIDTNFTVPLRLKVMLLRLFGAKIGKGFVIKSRVTIKQPWRLEVGDFVWIGENVWIDNLVKVVIANHVCISQGAMLLTGNHNYKLTSFDLITGEICLHDGVWIGAKAIVCPGVTCSISSVLTVGSVALSDLCPFGIYQGNPCSFKRKRAIAHDDLIP